MMSTLFGSFFVSLAGFTTSSVPSSCLPSTSGLMVARDIVIVPYYLLKDTILNLGCNANSSTELTKCGAEKL
jgi:hypothetical protein